VSGPGERSEGLFRLGEPLVAELVRKVRGGEPDAEADAEAFARIAWTVLVEPGDAAAGAFIAAVGAPRALEAVLEDAREVAVGAWLADGVDRRRAEREVASSFERWRLRVSSRSVVRAIEQAARLGIGVALPDDPWWPPGFAALGPTAPIALWLRGDAALLAALGSSIAVVGARAATGYGEHVATELAGGLAERGIGVVSGGAYGIDAAAHRAALASDGFTAAFLAGGLDRLYPAGNDQLLTRVAEQGILLAEVPVGVPPTRQRFLSRNRMLAASTAATVVVEAGYRSGSLNTAHHALEAGRPLGVVPGPITSPTSAGCHRLLRETEARCITSVDDVVELAGGERSDAPPSFERLDAVAMRVVDELGVRRGRAAEEIARSSGLTLGEVLAALGPLELDGYARRVESGWVAGPMARRSVASGEGRR